MFAETGRFSWFVVSGCEKNQPDRVLYCVLSENLVYLVPYMLATRRLQVAHSAFNVGVTEPLLNRAQIDASPE